MGFADDKSTLVQVMAWCRQTTSHYLSQCWPSSMSPYGVIRPQWVNIQLLDYKLSMWNSNYGVFFHKLVTRLRWDWWSGLQIRNSNTHQPVNGIILKQSEPNCNSSVSTAHIWGCWHDNLQHKQRKQKLSVWWPSGFGCNFQIIHWMLHTNEELNEYKLL